MRYYVDNDLYTEKYEIKCPICGGLHFTLAETRVMVGDRTVNSLVEDMNDNLYSESRVEFDYDEFYTLRCKNCPGLIHLASEPSVIKEEK